MILERIEVKDFLSHGQSEVDFRDASLWLIAGDNGSGKSALFDAVEYALYGSHRGEGQNAELLVKQGTRAAKITVVFQLQGELLRVIYEIDVKKGNQGGRLSVWDNTQADWKPRNVGDGKKAVWEWLKPRLPSHDYFRSAVFLRQNQTAHFLRGTASDRSKRFAALVDLSRYTQLSKRAHIASQAAYDARKEIEGMRKMLGDLSDAQLSYLADEAADRERQLTEARTASGQARTRREAAENWARLQVTRSKLEQRQDEIDALLRKEQTILDAAVRVAAWDQVAGQLREYWSHRDTCGTRRLEAAAKRREADTTETSRAIFEAALVQIQERLRRIDEQDQPAAEQRLADATAQRRCLEHEKAISKVRLELSAARSAADRLGHADTELAQWQRRAAALPRLTAVAQARAASATARTALTPLMEDYVSHEREYKQAQEELSTAEQLLESSREHLDICNRRINQLDAVVTRLDAQIAGHSTLDGGEPVCPVCTQTLDEETHSHVREVLAAEHAELVKKEAELQEQARPAAKEAAEAVSSVEKRVRKGRISTETTREAMEKADRELHGAETRREGAENALRKAIMQLLDEYPEPRIAPDDIDSAAVADERAEVNTMLEPAQEAAKELGKAREAVNSAESRLHLLRDQRTAKVEQLGETLQPDAIASLLGTLVEETAEYEKQLKALKDERKELAKEQTTKHADQARLAAEVEGKRARAGELEQEATDEEQQAEAIARSLPGVWELLLSDKDVYQQERQSTEAMRDEAGRVGELAEARGERNRVVKDLDELVMAEQQIALDDRIPVQQAKDAESSAQETVLQVQTEYGTATQAIQVLHENRLRDEELRAQIEMLTAEHETFSELGELLKEHGAIQRQVAQQEQRRVAQEANHILQLLNDPLRIRIDQARRGSDQDVTIVDISDIAGGASDAKDGSQRYFEFLSGGEQFRIALSLALALHRRLGGGEPGTVIVDEGFGALDGDRRDALALQMTDTSHGILGLGLARNLIICSHAVEVQRHFANRWIVEKRSGTATVRRNSAMDV